MVTINCNNFMKFMKSSEPISLPADIEGVRRIMRKFDKSCIVIRNLNNYFIGSPVMSKSNAVSYVFETEEGEKSFLYSNLKEICIPRNLCDFEQPAR